MSFEPVPRLLNPEAIEAESFRIADQPCGDGVQVLERNFLQAREMGNPQTVFF